MKQQQKKKNTTNVRNNNNNNDKDNHGNSRILRVRVSRNGRLAEAQSCCNLLLLRNSVIYKTTRSRGGPSRHNFPHFLRVPWARTTLNVPPEARYRNSTLRTVCLAH